MTGRRKPERPSLDDISAAKESIDSFLLLVDDGALTAPTPREVAIVRRLQGASGALGALLKDFSNNRL